jgi:hypothetical protein
VFVARLSAASARSVTFTSQTVAGSATAGSDFLGHGPTARTIPAGATSTTIAVAVLGDTTDEPDEDYALVLSGLGNAHAGGLTANGVIVDDDATPVPGVLSLAASSYTSREDADVTVEVRRDDGSDGAVSVAYATANGTAAAPGDFVALAGTLTFGPGETSRTLTIDLNTDRLVEDQESFAFSLSSPTGGASLGAVASATVFVEDDDVLPTLSIENGGCTVAEGGPGTLTPCVFLFRLSEPTDYDVTFTTSAVPVSASDESDFDAHGPTQRTIPRDGTELAVPVTVRGDGLDEEDETFRLDVGSITNAAGVGLPGIGRILDDDGLTTVSVIDDETIEGDDGVHSLEIRLTLQPPATRTVSVAWETIAGSATAGADFDMHSGVATFHVGSTGRDLDIPVRGDRLEESDETFVVRLSQIEGAVLGDAEATATILDDDLPGGRIFGNGFEQLEE